MFLGQLATDESQAQLSSDPQPPLLFRRVVNDQVELWCDLGPVDNYREVTIVAQRYQFAA